MRKRVISVALVTLSLIAGGAVPAEAANPVFYLNMKAGSCYSFTSVAKKPAKIGNNIKSLYLVSCASNHHFQVIKAGLAPSTHTALTDDELYSFCGPAYFEKFGADAPSDISAGAVYLRWFYPDPGAETKKFGRKTICLVHTSDSKYANYTLNKLKF